MTTRTILLIDDDLLLGQLVRALAQKQGFDLVQAVNGHRGLQLAAERRFDCIMVDLMLPQIDGLNVLRSLREQVVGFETRLIAISGRNNPEQQAECYAAGADSFLGKPVNPGQLHAALERVGA